jgi:hypothetical protein
VKNIAQSVAQTIFLKINTVVATFQNIAKSKQSPNRRKIAQQAKNRPIWSHCL